MRLEMKIRVPSYFKDFKCIASACEDTCCAGWDIVVDEEMRQCYQNIEGEFGKKLRSKMVVDEEGDNIFVREGNNCPFLNKNNLCEIYKELGEQYLCYTCRQYPRYMEEFLDLREMGIALSCPEAARIIVENRKPTAFEVSEETQIGNTDDGIDEKVLEELLLCRNTIMAILEMPDKALEIRIGIVLKYVEEIQDKIDFDELDEIKSVREKYNTSSFIETLIKDLERYRGNEDVKYANVYEYFKTYRDLEHINANDPLGLNKALSKFWKNETDKVIYRDGHKTFNAYYKDNMYKFKNILVYFIFRYFMKAIFDYDVSSKIKIAIMSTIMIKELAVIRWIEKGELTKEDIVAISHMYAKDVEHLEENIETLQTIFETEEVYKVDKILMTVMNLF